MKTEKRLSALVLTALVLAGAQAKAFFDLHIGRWAARDPLEEKSGCNLNVFALNNPIRYVDKAGLSPYGFFEVALRDVDYKDETFQGFQSKYILDEKVPCPCDKKENIVLIQAVKSPMYSPRIDASDAQIKENHSKKGGIPPPPYVSWTTYKDDPLLIVDAPMIQNSEKNNGTWQFEDCAVCRDKYADGTWNDEVMGCVKFNFKRVSFGKTELEVETAGKTLTGQRSYKVAAEDPGSIWTKAMEQWKKDARH